MIIFHVANLNIPDKSPFRLMVRFLVDVGHHKGRLSHCIVAQDYCLDMI
jgi:hypothetical protein